MNSYKRYIINIKGIVQGVGFRPFVYNLANEIGIKGRVNNYPGGVLIQAEGTDDVLHIFSRRLEDEAPPLAYIEEIRCEEAEFSGYTGFTIEESTCSEVHDAYISPDIGVCRDCLREMYDPGDRRFLYPFINCTNCGPRFTITAGIPYDRINTTMAPFVMCESCRAEYENPSDRRFHAQPVACPRCGPRLVLMDKNRQYYAEGKELDAARQLIKGGHILAVKGLGGYHLACDALNRKAVEELRIRKIRDGKPFALMVRDVKTASRYCEINENEAELLESIKRPVVLLKRKQDSGVPFEFIAADNHYLGIMLPYTPLHYLLFDENLEILVMTSGNRSGEPIYYKDREALEGLGNIADYFLLHNREIYIRTDDSVTSIFRDKEYLIRRSRGYVPYPINLEAVYKKLETEPPCILACGGELKSTFCLVKKGKAFISHHIGDLENLETLKSFEDGIQHFQSIFSVKPGIIAHDLHPEYLSTKYAASRDEPDKIAVQHHHSHIASCMAENGLDGPVIGVAFDGTGYGEDGRIWGGEFFTGDYSVFKREAHFEYIPMPGGDKSIKEPWRMAYSYVTRLLETDCHIPGLGGFSGIKESAMEMTRHQLLKGINTPETSSLGRLFDAVSSLLGLCQVITYEGEAAIKLEKVVDRNTEHKYSYNIDRNSEGGPMVIRLESLIKGIIDDIINGREAGLVSAAFHNTIADITVKVCELLRDKKGINIVALSGGVFQNRLLLDSTVKALEVAGFEVYTHSRVPANDGGISLGQAAIALHRYNAK